MLVATVVAIGLGLFLFSGFVHVGQHAYFDFAGVEGIEVQEAGRMQERAYPFGDIPLEYVLKRPSYELQLIVYGYSPHVDVKLINADEKVRLSAKTDDEKTSRCVASLIRENYSMVVFRWLSGQGCDGSGKLRFDVTTQDGVAIAHEVLPFQIVDDGYYFILDGP